MLNYKGLGHRKEKQCPSVTVLLFWEFKYVLCFCLLVNNLQSKKRSKAHGFIGARFKDKDYDNDFYPTPPETTVDLMVRELFEGTIWECACGDGRMSEVLEIFYPNQIYSSDLIDRGYGEAPLNFLDVPEGEKMFDHIITNPPYELLEEFIEQAKKHTRKKIAFLLKLQHYEADKRYDMWKDKEFPVKKFLIFSKRQQIWKGGLRKKNGGMIGYMWVIWDKDYKGEPTVDWIND